MWPQQLLVSEHVRGGPSSGCGVDTWNGDLVSYQEGPVMAVGWTRGAEALLHAEMRMG